MKYYYEPNDNWYDTKQDLVDAYNEDFEGTHSTKVTIDNWTEEQWNTILKPNMKKLEIKTEKATLLVVDDSDWDGCIHEFVGVNYNGFKYLGKVSEITEEEWRGIVDTGVDFVKETTHYIDYVDESSLYRTAAMSGLSLLKANGVILDIPEKPYFISKINSEEDRSKSQEQMENYFNELPKVWSNPHVFIKIERGN